MAALFIRAPEASPASRIVQAGFSGLACYFAVIRKFTDCVAEYYVVGCVCEEGLVQPQNLNLWTTAK